MTEKFMPEIDLTIFPKRLGVPYIPDNGFIDGNAREDNAQNYGFKVLKGNSDLILDIPEIKDDESLKYVLTEINKVETDFFTIGCEKAIIFNDGLNGMAEGYLKNGYIQISYNYRLLFGKKNYEELYKRFEIFLRKATDNLPVKFIWEIQETWFDAVNTLGYSVAIKVITAICNSVETCENIWDVSLKILSEFLSDDEHYSENDYLNPIY